MTADPQELLLQLLDPAHRADPYPVLRQLRESTPRPRHNLCLFGSYADCDEILRHPSACNDQLKSTWAQRAIAAGQPTWPFGVPGFLFLDPPDHTRLRKLVSKAFSPKVVRSLESDIAGLVSGLLDKVEQTGRFEAIGDLAYPLPVAVICRLLGVPIEDEPRFGSLSAVLAQGVDPFITLTGQARGIDERLEAGLWMRRYMGDLLEQRRLHPGEDLMSALIAVEESGDQLTEDEIVSTCILLLIAGHETTVNLIANAMLAMLRHPRYWEALSRDSGLAPAIVEETLRYDSPVQMIGRVAGEDMTINGVELSKGDIMMLLLPAANRDPAINERPDEFDPGRPSIRHLAVGFGSHFCIGAPLARMEAAVALSAVTKRFPQARLAAEPTYKPHVTLRGLDALEIRIG